jgi:hypothetical protein
VVVLVAGSPVVVVLPFGTKTQASRIEPQFSHGIVGGGEMQLPSFASGQFSLHGAYPPAPASGSHPKPGKQYQRVPPLHRSEHCGGGVGGRCGTGGETKISQLSSAIGGGKHPGGQLRQLNTPSGSRYQTQFPFGFGVVVVSQLQGAPVVVVVVVVGPHSGGSLTCLLQLVKVHSPSLAAQNVGFKHWQCSAIVVVVVVVGHPHRSGGAAVVVVLVVPPEVVVVVLVGDPVVVVVGEHSLDTSVQAPLTHDH